MEWLTHSQAGFRQSARYLLWMRVAIIAIALVAMAIAETMVALPYRGEAVLLCLAYGVLSVLAWLWFMRRPPAAPGPVSATFLADLALIGGWLYLTGGYTNPLVSLLLLPIAVAIILVPVRHSLVITLAGIAVYTALMLWHAPIGAQDHHHGNLAQLHLVGMWATFALTAVILLLVAGTLARRLRRQQSQLARFRENRLRDEQIIALGLSAAAVAHRLGTPLNTLTLLLEEVRAQLTAPTGPDREAVRDDLDTMEQQLRLCSEHLQHLTRAAVEAKGARREVLPVAHWLARLRESATLLWPSGPIQWRLPFPDTPVAVDATLDQAVLNLLANALTASPAWVGVSARDTGDGRVEVVVEDQGDGLEAALQGAPGEEVVDSQSGLGVGLFLSNATIQRLGGHLKARTNDQGTTMVIDLPRAKTTEGES